MIRITSVIPALRLLLAGLCLSLITATSWAQQQTPQLLVLVSQRNAENIADAARQFHQRYKDYTIVARTDTQLWEMTPLQIQALINKADMVLGIGLFGATVAELEPLLAALEKPLVIINSDHRLIQFSRLNGRRVFTDNEQLQQIAGSLPGQDFNQSLDELASRYPQQAGWINARRYWQAGGSSNTAGLFAWALHTLGAQVSVPQAIAQPRLRWQFNNTVSAEFPAISGQRPLLAILDHAGGDNPSDNALLGQLCEQAASRYGHGCLAALAYWGEAGVEAVTALQTVKDRLSAVVMLQDFVIGGGEGRESVTDLLTALDVPLIKAIKLRDRTALERHLSSDGIAYDKVYYQVAMPELQGASQPLVIATAGLENTDAYTGIRIAPVTAVSEGIDTLLSRAARWHKLRSSANSDKRIAIIYYNHPPGRHNIGADNLDVPASLWQILNRMKAEGYNTGTLPPSQQALLDLMQEHGVNLPNDAAALQSMSRNIKRIKTADYQQWFSTLPAGIRREMTEGPFGLLHEQIKAAVQQQKPELAKEALEHTLEEMHHLLEGVDHPGRARALALLEQLEHCYENAINQASVNCWNDALSVIRALRNTGIEGLGGWGDAPGKVMTYNNELLLPGLQFGSIFIGPQPPRGWEINEELLHANLAFPPPHQYLAFYYYLQKQFKADAIVHLGRHSTYEFLPHRSVGLAEDDYSRIIAADIPGIYPYIVDGVGEGIQAKRRGLAVMVDHLTPPLEHTPLYDDLLQLRQLVESFEANHGKNPLLANRLVQQIRDKVDALELRDELAAAMSAELAVMGISFEEVDDDMLVHEIGHYLTGLQERFMPLGLHIFGKPWEKDAITLMLNSMAPESAGQRREWQALLEQSPDAEMASLLRGLNGGFIAPGPGNDPIRSPASLPTGRNFYALDNSLIPSQLAWQLGTEMAQKARAATTQNPDKREALVLWASDVVRDEGVMIAFGLELLGLKPVWNSRGLVKGLERQPLAEGAVRRDVVFTTSGLFRDLYSRQMMLLDQATLLALDGSASRIMRDYPALTLALKTALKPLHDSESYGTQKSGNETLAQNQVAAHWVKHAQQLLANGIGEADAGVLASLRVFGDAPGSYGAGINRLVERSGAWQQREELAQVYLRRLGHSYGNSGFGTPAEAAFRHVLSDVENTYLGRSSNLYGLIDNNDAFDYLGGLSLAIETLTGKAPANYILNHASTDQLTVEPLALALRRELRGRFLNPEWLKGLMQHGYAGARTMGSEFLEYLWGWQVTNPVLVGDWAWQEVKEVYIDDRYDLQLDAFLEQGHNVHVKSNMLAIMLVAIHKQFWQADEKTIRQLAGQFADLVNQHGLPGSGHTMPDHPVLAWIPQYLTEQQSEALQAVIDKARAEPETLRAIYRMTELELQQSQNTNANAKAQAASGNSGANYHPALIVLIALLLLAIAAGFAHALYRSREPQQ